MVGGLWIVILGFTNGSVDYHGPFKNEARAKEYLMTAIADYQALRNKTIRGHVAPLIVPLKEGNCLKWV